MKLRIVSALLFLYIAGCAGYEYITPDQGIKEYIIDTSLQKDAAYSFTLAWIAKTYNSANDVVQLKDQDNGLITMQAMGSYYFDALKTVQIVYRYTLEIKIKDDKMKLIFTTGKTQHNGQYPQQGDLPKIFSKYDFLKNDLEKYLSNSDNNF